MPVKSDAQEATNDPFAYNQDQDKSFAKDFQYKHRNPYHDKLEEFSEFVLRDEEAEVHRGNWNKEVFTQDGELCLEIGTGYGHFMLQYCDAYRDQNFVGLDYRFKRSYALAKKLKSLPYRNFKYLRAKGERIEHLFAENELDKVFYFFPDPWPKARHHKKRLFQLPFLERAYKVIKPGGYFFVKTDHDGYAEWMKEVIEKQDLFELELETKDLWNDAPDHLLCQFKTKFEKIFIEQGVNIKAFVLKSKKAK